MEQCDDKELFKSFIKGDNKAFETLVIKYKNNLICYLMRYVNNIEQCEDIAQEVFAYVYANKLKFRFQSSIKTYMFRIAKNKAIDYLRRQKPSDQLDYDIADSFDLAQQVIQNENAILLHKAIGKLKPEYAAAIHLVDIEQFSYVQAAKAQGKTQAQFKVLLHRARKSLKEVLIKEGFEYEN